MKQDCIDKICSLPVDFKIVNKSIFKLATESQFPIYADQIDVIDIKTKLQSDIDLIKAWKLYSEDKRTTGGYYFTSKHIGAINKNAEVIFRKDFTSDLDACAEYIIREVSSILDIKANLEN